MYKGSAPEAETVIQHARSCGPLPLLRRGMTATATSFTGEVPPVLRGSAAVPVPTWSPDGDTLRAWSSAGAPELAVRPNSQLEPSVEQPACVWLGT